MPGFYTHLGAVATKTFRPGKIEIDAGKIHSMSYDSGLFRNVRAMSCYALITKGLEPTVLFAF